MSKKIRELQRIQMKHALAQAEAQGAIAASVRNKLNLDEKRLRPLADQVLLRIELEEERGGIIIPQQAQLGTAALPVGVVVAIGPDVKRAKVGDRLLVHQSDVRKIDTLLWLAPDAKLLCGFEPAAPKVQTA